MALNWTILDESRRPLPLPNEHTVMNIDRGVDLTLTVPTASESSKKLKENGRIWLTEQRLIFVTTQNSGQVSFESLSIPLLSLLSTSFVQPTFAANYLVVDIKPTREGGLTEGSKAEIRFKDQGMFGFVSALEKVRERALYMKRESALDDQLPVYSSPSTFAASSTTPLPAATAGSTQPSDAPPGYDAI